MDFLQILSSGASRGDAGAVSAQSQKSVSRSSDKGFFSVLNEELVGNLAKDKPKPEAKAKKEGSILERNVDKSTLRPQAKRISEEPRAEENVSAPEVKTEAVITPTQEEIQTQESGELDIEANEKPLVSENLSEETPDIQVVVAAEQMTPVALPELEVPEAPEATEAPEAPEELPTDDEIKLSEKSLQPDQPKPVLETGDTRLTPVEVSPSSPQELADGILELLTNEDVISQDPQLRKNLQELVQKLQLLLPEDSVDAKAALDWIKEALENAGEGLEEIKKFLSTEFGSVIEKEISSELQDAIKHWQNGAESQPKPDSETRKDTKNLSVQPELMLESVEVETEDVALSESKSERTEQSQTKNLQDSIARLTLKITDEAGPKQTTAQDSDTIELQKLEDMPVLATDSEMNHQPGNESQSGNKRSQWGNILSSLSQRGFSEELIQEVTKEIRVDSEGTVRSVEQHTLSKGKVQGNLRNPGFVSSTRVMVQQVMEQIQRLAPPEVTKIRMVLRPEALGELRLEVKQNKTGLEVKIETQTQAVKEVLERNLLQLRDSLKTSGLENAEIKISSREDFSDSFSQARGQDAESKSDRGKQRQKTRSSGSDEIETDGLEDMNLSTLHASGSRVNLSA
ncbi:MAG: flagellar hook-length control protein FliK [Candidatus Cloacimonetes bacterium]|nr:flagellar hook-length control protein FliK [Candidatus Cloacimonadota bacterium]